MKKLRNAILMATTLLLSAVALPSLSSAVPTGFTVTGFASSVTTLTSSQQARVLTIANAIKNGDVTRVTVKGYTDSAGSVSLNHAIGTGRASSVTTLLRHDLHLLGDSGVAISSIGEGATSYVATNTTLAGRARNRRVVISFAPVALTFNVVYEGLVENGSFTSSPAGTVELCQNSSEVTCVSFDTTQQASVGESQTLTLPSANSTLYLANQGSFCWVTLTNTAPTPSQVDSWGNSTNVSSGQPLVSEDNNTGVQSVATFTNGETVYLAASYDC